MPELPEVQTTVNGLNATVKGKKITDIWTSYKSSHKMHRGSIKDSRFFLDFKNKVKNQKIIKSERRAKNILIHITGGHTILIHMKMTGHLLYGKYEFKKGIWTSTENKFLSDPFNGYIRLVFSLDNGKHLAFSDMRKFAKVTLIETAKLDESLHVFHLGPEPLSSKFIYKVFKDQLLKRPAGKIKQVLMDQTLIAGIGNIYSDEILWRGNVHPLSLPGKIPEKNLKLMFNATKETLKRGIDFGGDSMSDYRNIYGKRGKFQDQHKAYQKQKTKCGKPGCRGIIEKMKVGGRSAHFCPVHQKLFK